MPSLHEVESRFFAAVMAGGEAEDRLLACLAEDADIGRERIAVYRRSVMGNLVSALHATYPVLAKIVGLPFFREAARAYVRAHPSESGDLNEYGASFAGFIGDYPHGRDLGYLADVARLEWLVQQVYYAAEPAPADLSALAACPPERYGDLRFELTPAHARIDSRWPVADIWRVNADGYAGDMTIDWSQGSRALVWRRDALVEVAPLTAGEAAFIDALVAGRTLAAATDLASTAEPGFDPGTALAHCVGRGVVRAARLDFQGAPS